MVGFFRTKYENILDKLPLPWDDNEFLWADAHTAYGVTNIITQDDFMLEGRMLAHCLGTKKADDWNVWHRMFSIRDDMGVPHATILATRNPQKSPYGMCRDLVTGSPMEVDGENLWVLQVRGRGDALAMLDFHRIARRFFLAHNGYIRVTERNLDDIVRHNRPDKDMAYHFEYKYDPRPFAAYDYTWQDVERDEEARQKGLVH